MGGGHRLEAHDVLGGRREDLRSRITLLEVDLDTSATAGHREHRAVGNLVISVVKSPVAQRFTQGRLDDRLASGQALVR